MISNPDVLVIGLDPYRVPGPWDPKPVADAIEIGMKALLDGGFHAEACLVGLDGGDNIQARVTGALQARSWDCVIVGGGIREPEEQLKLFESVINLIRRHAPQAAIAFTIHRTTWPTPQPELYITRYNKPMFDVRGVMFDVTETEVETASLICRGLFPFLLGEERCRV